PYGDQAGAAAGLREGGGGGAHGARLAGPRIGEGGVGRDPEGLRLAFSSHLRSEPSQLFARRFPIGPTSRPRSLTPAVSGGERANATRRPFHRLVSHHVGRGPVVRRR